MLRTFWLIYFHRISYNVYVLYSVLLKDDICYVLQKKLHVTDKFIDRLGLEVELEGHEGCVNCLEWNESGRLDIILFL